jgi:two-component system invasion response regulator UvrY
VNIRIFIVDDHALIREGIKKILGVEAGCAVVGEAHGGLEVFDRLDQCRCDVLILDLSLPDKGGLEVLKEVKIRRPKTRVLVLSMHAEEHFAIRALEDGADGYLAKNSAADELVTALKTVMSGKKYISPAVAQELGARLGHTGERAAHQRLSDKEHQVMLLLGAGETVSRIARKINLSVSTVNTHRQHILKKMGLKTNGELIRYVIENNLQV